MSANVEQEAVAEIHHIHNAATTNSSTGASNSTRMSMFKGKVGFVIPKNKFSGSLVPVFRGGKKSESSETATEESSKQAQRKTKWGPDLTQDINVRRGRALAYQTRVDQITQQLKLGSLSDDGQNSEVAGDFQDREPTTDIDYEKLKILELERREAIGEILKLNPSYKAPFDYQPVIREAAVSIPVKEYPEFNFIALVYGPDGDTQKRLEKETGTKMQVYGLKSETREKVEIMAFDGSEVLSCCDELYVQIAADTWEIVDAAAALIELLLSSVPGKSAGPNGSPSVSGDNLQVLDENQDLGTISADDPAIPRKELAQIMMGPISTSSQIPFQQFQGSWFPTNQFNLPSGVGPFPSSMAFPLNPSPRHAVFMPRSTTPYGFGSSPQNILVGPPRSHPPVQVMQHPFMPPGSPFGQTGPPRNLSGAMSPSPSPLTGHLSSAAGLPSVRGPQLIERPMNPSVKSPGWAVSPAGAPQLVATGNLVSPLGSSRSSLTPFPSQVGHTLATSFVPSQIQSSSAIPLSGQSFAPLAAQLNPRMNNLSRPGPPPPPPASHPQSGPAVGSLNAPSFTPVKPMGGPTLRPLHPGSNDFTFLPQRPQGPPHSISGPNVQFTSQRPPGPLPTQLPPLPQAPSFRLASQNIMPQHMGQSFPRPQTGPYPGQFGPPSPNPHMSSRNHGPVPQMPNTAGPFPPRPGNSPQYQQSYPAPPLGRPGGPFVTNQHSNPSSRPQVYDPFSPTSVASAQGNSTIIPRKQDSDPEYEDLMASVGVK